MRAIDAAGTARQIGEQVGRAAPELVRRSVDLIARVGLADDALERRLEPIRRRLGDVFPGVLDEAEGLADGAGISPRDALVLSVASDVHGRLPGWCSLGAAAGRSGALLGKNLDTTEAMAEVQVVEVIRRAGAYPFAHVTAAGAMWTDGGVNERGLGVVNASIAAAGHDPAGLPDGIVVREALARCVDVGEAVAFLSEHRVMTLGENVLVADAAGRTASVTTLPGGCEVHEPAPAAVCNRPLGTRLASLAAQEDPIRANSERRLVALDTALSGRSEWPLTALAAVLADHDGSICQHGEDGLWTVASLVVEPRSRRMWVADGAPCRAAFGEVPWGKGDAPHAARTTEEVVTDGS